MDEREVEYATKVFGGLLKSRENATTFFEPSNQAFNDVPLAIGFTIELDRACVAIFVGSSLAFEGITGWISMSNNV